MSEDVAYDGPHPQVLRQTITDMKLESIRDRALIARLMRYAREHLEDDRMKAVYATIAKHNLGDNYTSGGSGDAYVIPEGS